MNRSELVAEIASQSGLDKADVTKALDGLTAVLSSAVAGGDKVQLAGLATFEPVDRPARTGRNPQTGEPLAIPARRAVKISAAAALKKAVAGS
jgi:DNA-binding protein HU-beta